MFLCVLGGHFCIQYLRPDYPWCNQNALLTSLFVHDRLQFADSIAVWAYAFGVTMAILIVLEPFMFLSRQRWLRGGRGWRTVTMPVVDRGTIREEIPMDPYVEA